MTGSYLIEGRTDGDYVRYDSRCVPDPKVNGHEILSYSGSGGFGSSVTYLRTSLSQDAYLESLLRPLRLSGWQCH